MAATATQTAISHVSLPPDTYIYALSRLSSSIACIASDDSLSLLDASTLDIKHKISQCHKSVTSSTSVTGSKTFATGGRDATVNIWDERKETPISTLSISNGQGVSAIAVSDNLVAAGTENTRDGPGDVGIYVWDVRSPLTPLRTYPESHNDTITTLSFSPSSSSSSPSNTNGINLLSSSTDALLTLFDPSKPDEDDAVRQVFNHAAAVHIAHFLSPDEICAVSSDESLSVYEISRPEDVEREDVAALATTYGDLRPQLDAGYVARAVRGPDSDAAETTTWVASGELERAELRLTPLVRTGGRTKWGFEHARALRFPGAHGQEVVRDVLIDHSSRAVFSCGEDGTVRAWSVPDTEGGMGVEDPEEEEEVARREKKRLRKKEKREKERFKPY